MPKPFATLIASIIVGFGTETFRSVFIEPHSFSIESAIMWTMGSISCIWLGDAINNGGFGKKPK